MMVGSFGCPCERCQGVGTIAMQLRAKLCALERLLGVEMVVTMGYRCEGMREALGAGLRERAHSHCNEDGLGYALAVDFYPRNHNPERLETDGKRWGNRRFDFIELVRPFFDSVWVSVGEGDPNKWSVHGEIVGETDISGG